MQALKQAWRWLKRRSRYHRAIAVLLATCLTLLWSNPLLGQASSDHSSSPGSTRSLEATLAKLPAPQSHPLPPTLAQWQDPQQSGDYFDQVKPVVVGALLWTQFPITVYVEPITATEQALPFTSHRAKTWIAAIEQAIAEWNRYLPLQPVEQPEQADIRLWRSTPPLRIEKAEGAAGDRKQPLIPRARSAETRFEFYARPSTTDKAVPQVLAHRMSIFIRPDQALEYLQAAARHELGHALGIWGHSPQATDALYFSQVRHPAKISARDLNTLKRVYQQPTRLGWPIPPES